MRYVGLAYRGHNPKWAFAPTSGDGAAIHGGRFNPRGIPALYLSTSIEGAFLEATRGFAYKFSPLTMCAYELDCSDIIDLTEPAGRHAAGISLDEMSCPWFEDLSDGRRPASWTIYDRLQGAAAGLLVPSFADGASNAMQNLVLWHWGDQQPHRVAVHDPEQRLPRNQKSWE